MERMACGHRRSSASRTQRLKSNAQCTLRVGRFTASSLLAHLSGRCWFSLPTLSLAGPRTKMISLPARPGSTRRSGPLQLHRLRPHRLLLRLRLYCNPRPRFRVHSRLARRQLTNPFRRCVSSAWVAVHPTTPLLTDPMLPQAIGHLHLPLSPSSSATGRLHSPPNPLGSAISLLRLPLQRPLPALLALAYLSLHLLLSALALANQSLRSVLPAMAPGDPSLHPPLAALALVADLSLHLPLAALVCADLCLRPPLAAQVLAGLYLRLPLVAQALHDPRLHLPLAAPALANLSLRPPLLATHVTRRFPRVPRRPGRVVAPIISEISVSSSAAAAACHRARLVLVEAHTFYRLSDICLCILRATVLSHALCFITVLVATASPPDVCNSKPKKSIWPHCNPHLSSLHDATLVSVITWSVGDTVSPGDLTNMYRGRIMTATQNQDSMTRSTPHQYPRFRAISQRAFTVRRLREQARRRPMSMSVD